MSPRLDAIVRDAAGNEARASLNVEIRSSEPEWTRVLEDETFDGDVVVPSGEHWRIGRNVQVVGNFRAGEGGALSAVGMRPGGHLKLVGANPDEYVGGAMRFGPGHERDIGAWIGPNGVFDIRGTQKQGWNRTGSHSTWGADDECYIAPSDVGDYKPRVWRPGDPVPQFHPRVPPTEVMNVSRDCIIEGPGHVHIHAHHPQRIEYLQLRGLGASNAKFGGPVLGCYGLHLHHAGDATRGTIIRGVAAIGSRGRVLVIHDSHGVLVEDFVSVNSFAEPFWWDVGDRTNDILLERFCASGMHMPRSVSGSTYRANAAVLGGGDNMRVRRSAVSGARGGTGSHGWDWPSAGDNNGPNMWEFQDELVVHNVEGAGVRFWSNNPDNHETRVTAYNCGGPSIENGAYRNSNRFNDCVLIGSPIRAQASSHQHRVDGGPQRWERGLVSVPSGPAFVFGHLNLPPLLPTEVIDYVFETPDPVKIRWSPAHDSNDPVWAIFRRCKDGHGNGLKPENVEIGTPSSIGVPVEGSLITIDNEDGGPVYEIAIENGERVDREVAA